MIFSPVFKIKHEYHFNPSVTEENQKCNKGHTILINNLVKSKKYIFTNHINKTKETKMPKPIL